MGWFRVIITSCCVVASVWMGTVILCTWEIGNVQSTLTSYIVVPFREKVDLRGNMDSKIFQLTAQSMSLTEFAWREMIASMSQEGWFLRRTNLFPPRLDSFVVRTWPHCALDSTNFSSFKAIVHPWLLAFCVPIGHKFHSIQVRGGSCEPAKRLPPFYYWGLGNEYGGSCHFHSDLNPRTRSSSLSRASTTLASMSSLVSITWGHLHDTWRRIGSKPK